MCDDVLVSKNQSEEPGGNDNYVATPAEEKVARSAF